MQPPGVSGPQPPGPPPGPRPDADFPADPYPGTVPPFSFAHVDGRAHPITASGSGWRVVDGDGAGPGGTGLDAWLAGRDAAPLAGRVPLLAYGSNRNPTKITWLREELRLGDEPVVVLRARTTGVAAVWAAGLRRRDGQRIAVLAAAPGVEEEHAVWMATPAQLAVLDRCEGRGERYRLARLHTGTVRTEDGSLVDAPWCYLGLSAIRRPLLVRGRPVRCADVPHAAALHLVGEPASGDGLHTSSGVPRTDH
ncbi:MAG TPA: hypothetical protein VD813_08980 [Pseudonocardia sp.]|nr:hypothetical protein [Pseudonocardia sp.]